MKDDGLTQCARKCLKEDKTCKESGCRKWIDFEEDNNCCLISIRNKGGDGLTLMETGERIGLSFVRVRQIEQQALKKLSKLV
jgi:DNA-directed RNA polymerase sigma subunit (sigma70/sigma32)|tara:strand:- start:1111 stop:1356 length:246 start_codon:yes stop_codon:yes gene_type:complete